MEATKGSLVLPLTYYWSEHFSVWVIRDGDNHQIGQVDTEQKGCLIVTACNLHEELVEALKRAIPWLGKMIADGNHLECVRPSDAEQTLALMQAITAKAEKEEIKP